MLLADRRIFIVEDNSGNLAIASIYLEQQGATIKFNRWGEYAVESILRHLPIDAILMDLMLSGKMNGFDVFEQIQQQPLLAQIPVIAISASDPDIAIPKTKQMGFAGFIAKPVSPQISGYIHEVLQGNPIWIAEGGVF